MWSRLGRWLVAGLTFQLAADVIETAIAPQWDDIGRLGAIAVIRTFLNYFLERDLSEVERAARAGCRRNAYGRIIALQITSLVWVNPKTSAICRGTSAMKAWSIGVLRSLHCRDSRSSRHLYDRAGRPAAVVERRAAKEVAIIDFVTRVTTYGAADYVPEPARIATFDNDGTLWAEQPDLFPVRSSPSTGSRRWRRQHPEWKTKEPFEAVLSRRQEGAPAAGREGPAADHGGDAMPA